MIIEIDQSGKIEETAKDTVIAFTDKKGFKQSIKITAREKRKLQKFFRNLERPRFYTHKVFSVLIFLLIKDYLHKLDRIIIDPEYPGYEELLRNLIFELIQATDDNFEKNQITFKRVGKQSSVHDLAWHVFRRLKKPSRTVASTDLLKIITK